MPAAKRASARPLLPSPESVRKQLEQILVSPSFAGAARSRRFLTYIVEQTLAGNADSVKETVLGIDVFDRAGGFDPKIDTIVRVEAGKLRKRLEDFYALEGVAAVRIEVPKGSYVPRFHWNDTPPFPAARSRLMRPLVPVAALLLIAYGIWWATRGANYRHTARLPSQCFPRREGRMQQPGRAAFVRPSGISDLSLPKPGRCTPNNKSADAQNSTLVTRVPSRRTTKGAPSPKPSSSASDSFFNSKLLHLPWSTFL